jgi:uncharacterized Zn finger protein
MKENIWHPDGSRKILDEIEAAGLVHGWFIYHSSFLEEEERKRRRRRS